MRKQYIPVATKTVNIKILLNGLHEIDNSFGVMKQF